MRKIAALLAIAFLAVPAWALDAKAPPKLDWPFEGAFASYDRASLRRGFQVYREICSACHGLKHLRFHDLVGSGGLGYSRAEAQAIAESFRLPAEPNEAGETTDENGSPLTRPGRLADPFPSPFPNVQAARNANSGALPPDLTLMVKARAGGADYIHALITGFNQPPPGFKLADGMNYNPYFPGGAIAMQLLLTDDSVMFADGTKATRDREARDVVAFLAWAADPHAEARKKLGFQVMAFLALFAGLTFLSFRKVWKGKE